jgi:hypothetical protein
VYRHDNFSSLKCRSTPIAYVTWVGCCCRNRDLYLCWWKRVGLVWR